MVQLEFVRQEISCEIDHEFITLENCLVKNSLLNHVCSHRKKRF